MKKLLIILTILTGCASSITKDEEARIAHDCLQEPECMLAAKADLLIQKEYERAERLAAYQDLYLITIEVCKATQGTIMVTDWHCLNSRLSACLPRRTTNQFYCARSRWNEL